MNFNNAKLSNLFSKKTTLFKCEAEKKNHALPIQIFNGTCLLSVYRFSKH